MKEKDFPIIESLKTYKEHLNITQMINLPTDSNFGNLNLSWLEIIIRTELVNDLIIALYSDFEVIKLVSVDLKNFGYKQKFNTEQIFYWLRKTVDELISMISILSEFKNEKKYSKKIKICSIGDFLKANLPFNDDLKEYKAFLKTLNEISNCYKHSFINSQIHNLHGTDYPIVFAYSLHFNNTINSPKLHTLELRKILMEYDSFLKFIKEYIRKNFELDKNN